MLACDSPPLHLHQLGLHAVYLQEMESSIVLLPLALYVNV